MSREPESPSRPEIEARIERVGRYSRAVKSGLAIVVGAFVLAVVFVLPANLESPAAAVESVLMPLSFVGIATVLFGIGMHLHLLHLNLVRQLQPPADDDESDGPPGG